MEKLVVTTKNEAINVDEALAEINEKLDRQQELLEELIEKIANISSDYGLGFTEFES